MCIRDRFDIDLYFLNKGNAEGFAKIVLFNGNSVLNATGTFKSRAGLNQNDPTLTLTSGNSITINLSNRNIGGSRGMTFASGSMIGLKLSVIRDSIGTQGTITSISYFGTNANIDLRNFTESDFN